MDNYKEFYGVDTLTPVESYNGVYFKRDDLYMPFDDIPLSGGKVRQCVCLIGENEDYIRNECDSLVTSGTSLSSPQGIIISRVARDFGFRSRIYVGNTNRENILKKPLMCNILKQQGRINFESVMAYDSNLWHTIQMHIEGGEKMFPIKFGINAEDNADAILGSVANQVRNLPEDLDYLFVPCGSCIMLSGILIGLKKYGVNVKHVIGIQISGYDRNATIQKLLGGDDFPYQLDISKDFPYSKEVHHTISKGFDLDLIYEAKAWDWVLKHYSKQLKEDKCCFWVVGNSTPVRRKVF